MKNMQFFLNQANILIIGECDDNANILYRALKNKGYEHIINIRNDELVLKYIKENLPDIIILDISINEESGYEISDALGKDSELNEISIIFINKTEKINKDRIFNMGGADYLCTPLNEYEVIARIETQLKLKLMENEIEKLKDDFSTPNNELERINEELTKINQVLEKQVNEKTKQIDDITLELKEFNIILEEEINERTKTEEALKESERQFRYSIEEAPVPIMLYTEDGQVKKLNRTWTKITGYTNNDIPTISGWAEISEVFTSDIGDKDIKLFLSDTRLDEGEYTIRTRYQEVRVWNFYSAYIGEMQDGHKLFMRIAIDITEKKHMEEIQKNVEKERKLLNELKEYDRIKTEFFSNISHELRTPLNVIFSALQMHELKLKNCEVIDESVDIFKYTRIMKQNCYRILRLINNLIDITKIDSGYFDISKQNIDLVSLVENITLSVVDYVESKGLSLIFDTDIEEKIIACDPEKIERVILNLLSNAIKFTPFGGSIMVNIEDCLEKICIRIQDTGRGIPEEKIDSIFERFVQVDKSLNRDHEGSGIGLSLVKSLIELHEGTISVKSSIGIGTEFIIYIPYGLVDEVIEEFSFCDSIGKDCIEKINIEFSDIYSYEE
ncbi:MULTISPECIES: ATP-binding protein [unclassified Clostridium]|uniref:ATP-binding protein n=1 Tax=unclassified Clostridium TaxID=2614128 RepID=UPI000297F639|nr:MULTISPECIES: ATP-binding protein [unclassified Clostridium]EKQ56933.1 MAG: PAS domain S-box [Clostridium sp. Maddingley MBC34-26]